MQMVCQSADGSGISDATVCGNCDYNGSWGAASETPRWGPVERTAGRESRSWLRIAPVSQCLGTSFALKPNVPGAAHAWQRRRGSRRRGISPLLPSPSPAAVQDRPSRPRASDHGRGWVLGRPALTRFSWSPGRPQDDDRAGVGRACVTLGRGPTHCSGGGAFSCARWHYPRQAAIPRWESSRPE